jgi:hypothetical protein
MKDTNKKILKEFKIEFIKNEPYKEGELTLEYVEGYDYPRYVIYYETGDLEEGNTVSDIVAELDSRYFDGHMSETIMDYIISRK